MSVELGRFFMKPTLPFLHINVEASHPNLLLGMKRASTFGSGTIACLLPILAIWIKMLQPLQELLCYAALVSLSEISFRRPLDSMRAHLMLHVSADLMHSGPCFLFRGRNKHFCPCMSDTKSGCRFSNRHDGQRISSLSKPFYQNYTGLLAANKYRISEG